MIIVLPLAPCGPHTHSICVAMRGTDWWRRFKPFGKKIITNWYDVSDNVSFFSCLGTVDSQIELHQENNKDNNGTQSQSHTAAIKTKDLRARAFSWGKRTPFVGFPLRSLHIDMKSWWEVVFSPKCNKKGVG